MQRPGSLMLEPRRASQTQDESHTRPNLGKGRAGCVVPDVTPGRTLTQHNPVSNGGVFVAYPYGGRNRLNESLRWGKSFAEETAMVC